MLKLALIGFIRRRYKDWFTKVFRYFFIVVYFLYYFSRYWNCLMLVAPLLQSYLALLFCSCSSWTVLILLQNVSSKLLPYLSVYLRFLSLAVKVFFNIFIPSLTFWFLLWLLPLLILCILSVDISFSANSFVPLCTPAVFMMLIHSISAQFSLRHSTFTCLHLLLISMFNVL